MAKILIENVTDKPGLIKSTDRTTTKVTLPHPFRAPTPTVFLGGPELRLPTVAALVPLVLVPLGR